MGLAIHRDSLKRCSKLVVHRLRRPHGGGTDPESQRFLVSHPFRKVTRNGWGTVDCFFLAESAGLAETSAYTFWLRVHEG
jgi:hypothetical protein